MDARKAVCGMLDMAFRYDEDSYEWLPCTEALEIHAPIEELPCVLTLSFEGLEEIDDDKDYVFCLQHRRLEEVEQRLPNGVRSVCGCEICGLSRHEDFDLSPGQSETLYIPFRWRLFQRTPDGPLNVAADVAEIHYECDGVRLRWHNFSLSAWVARRRWEFTRLLVDGKWQPWTTCTAVRIPSEIVGLVLEALEEGVYRRYGIRPSILSNMTGAKMLTAYIERPFDIHIVYLKGFLAEAVEDFDEMFPYEETNPYPILCNCLGIRPPKSVRRAYTYNPYAVIWYMLLRQLGLQDVSLMQPFLELEYEFAGMSIDEFYFEPKTQRVERREEEERCLWHALERHARWLCGQKGEKALAEFLSRYYVWGGVTQRHGEILLNFQRYGAQLSEAVKQLLLSEGMTKYVRDAISWEVEAILSGDEPQRILYRPEILRYECCVNGYDFRLIHHTDELAPIGIALHNCLASYRDYVIEKESIIIAVRQGERYLACIEVGQSGCIVQALGKYNQRLRGRVLAIYRAWARYVGLSVDVDHLDVLDGDEEATNFMEDIVMTPLPYRRAMEEVALEELETLPEEEIEEGYYCLLGEYLARSVRCAVAAPPWMRFRGEMEYLMYVFPRGERLYRAALSGSVEAAHVLGLLYQRGWPIPCDVERARYWLSWAAERGDDEAALVAERLQRAIASGSMERDLAILRGIERLHRRFPMKRGVA